MNKYYLRVNGKEKNGKKIIVNYDLYDGEELIKSFSEDISKNITSDLRKNKIKFNKVNDDYVVDNKEFMKKFVKINLKRKKFKPKKVILIASSLILVGGIYYLYSKNKSSSVDNTTSITTNIISEDITTEKEITTEKKYLTDIGCIAENSNINTFTFEGEDRTNTIIEEFDNMYKEYIDKYSKMYGLDPRLIKAMICQENMYNEPNYSDNGGHGPMQIESILNGEDVTAYNFDTNSYDTETIDTNRCNDDIEYGIKMGCMLLNWMYNSFNSDFDFSNKDTLITALFSYNKGFYDGKKCASKSIDLNDFIENMRLSDIGDDYYLENVFSYLDDNTTLHMKTSDNKDRYVKIDNLSKKNTKGF